MNIKIQWSQIPYNTASKFDLSATDIYRDLDNGLLLSDSCDFFKLHPIRPDRLPLTNEGDERRMIGAEMSPPIDTGNGEAVVNRLEVVQGFLNWPDVGIMQKAPQRRQGL